MKTDDTVVELYRKYRPKRLEDVVGQGPAVKALEAMLKKNAVPHAVLFSGPSGCGKTTLARILAKRLGCGGPPHDYREINVAEDRGIDVVRQVSARLGPAPMRGSCRVWVFDEVHAMTRDGQSATLKMLEEARPHIYFMLCTTDPQKLLATVRTRCNEIRVGRVGDEELCALLAEVLTKESCKITEGVQDRIVELADGSARKALVLLHQVAGLDDEEEQLAVLDKANAGKKAIDIARTLIDRNKPWGKVAADLKLLDDEPETVRRVILSYYTSVLLGGGKFAGRAAVLLKLFECHFYDSGTAGLVLACYEAMTSKEL